MESFSSQRGFCPISFIHGTRVAKKVAHLIAVSDGNPFRVTFMNRVITGTPTRRQWAITVEHTQEEDTNDNKD
jgi:hypothetical protein